VSPAATIQRALAAGLLLAAAAVAAFALAAPIVSGDLFWHLSCGRWMLANGALLGLDPFSHTAADRAAELQEYGSQFVLGVLERAFGLDGLRAVGVVLALALVVVVQRVARRRVPGPTAAVLTALFVALYAYKWELRPQLFSAFVFLRLAHVLFERAPGAAPAPGNRALVETFLLCALWVQLHAEALFGPMLAATGAIGALCAAVFERREPLPVAARRLGRWVAAFAAALCGTFASPLGLEPHLYVLRDSSVARANIEEWQPMFVDPTGPRAFPLTLEFQFLVWALALAAALLVVRHGLVLVVKRGDAATPHFERFGFLCLCLLLAFMARRYFWLVWFVLLELAAYWHHTGGAGAAARAGARVRGALALAAGVALAVVALSVSTRTLVLDTARFAWREGRFTESVDSALFPVHATRFVREAGLDGNLYHPYSWGGYLGHQLWPANKVFVDGRTILFQEVIPIRQRIEREPAFAATELAARGVDVVVFQRVVAHGDGPMLWRPPDADTQWLRAWSDRVATVWVRRSRADLVAAVERWFANEGIDFEAARGFVEYAALETRPDWLDERRLFVDEIADQVRAPLARVGAGRAGALAWVELGEVARRFALERSARHAYAAALRALGRPDDLSTYERLGAERAFAELQRELRGRPERGAPR
jgi:hypothetical protein